MTFSMLWLFYTMYSQTIKHGVDLIYTTSVGIKMIFFKYTLYHFLKEIKIA